MGSTCEGDYCLIVEFSPKIKGNSTNSIPLFSRITPPAGAQWFGVNRQWLRCQWSRGIRQKQMFFLIQRDASVAE
jgi:hypothetical protein